ncbi:MAG: butyrate kinase [Spirochaetales bacterium]|nr:butyrate kinase [Spirochaetales bacterium]
MMRYLLLVINPGSTSTKIALYQNESCLYSEYIEHESRSIEKYNSMIEQMPMRQGAIENWLKKKGILASTLSAVVGRGGILPPVKSGAYRVNAEMIDRLKNRPLVEHASNLGAILAYEMASEIDIPSFIYDSVSVDELESVARISGMPLIERKSQTHVLNSRAMARRVAGKLGFDYKDKNFIVAHMGGGISISAHRRGRIIDVVADDEGPFSPERAGRVPCRELISLCYSGRWDEKEMQKNLRGNGGIKAYLGTIDVRSVALNADAGDPESNLIINAMTYQISKGIGELATVLKGDVDSIILTGGIAYSRMITGMIAERTEFIAPVKIEPGENELEALAFGVLRVLRGEEDAHEYHENQD